MMSNVVIASIELLTPIGLSAAEAADAAACGLTGFSSSSIILERWEALTSAWIPDHGLVRTDSDYRITNKLNELGERLVRIGITPLKRVMQNYPKAWPAPTMYMALPYERFNQVDATGLMHLIATGAAIPWNEAQSSAIVQGRAGGLAALHAAIDSVSSGQCPCALVGAVDSYCDFSRIARLYQQGRIKAERVSDGFIPGEAGGWLMITTQENAQQAGITPLALLGGVMEGFENGHLGSEEPYKGDALAQVIGQALKDQPLPITDVWSSMTGESHWVKEWSVAVARNKSRLAEAVRIHHPADGMGDVGTAAAIILVGLAVTTRHHQHSSDPLMVYASADDGPRAAIAITPIVQGNGQ